ncbi:MAG: CRISPR-associated endonuclease Cas1 [Mariprofundales bacterium]|nr:CRISPR-associated endonuclease Cas1 [Mariprofundales bacterium]
MKQPLYLGRRTTVRLDDGPSLVVSAPKRVECRFPLLRTSQLVAYAGTGLSEDVLLACLRHQIPILWQNRDGSALAISLPFTSGNQPWAERISAMISRPGWRARYDSWLAAQHRMVLRVLATRYHLNGERTLDAWLDLFFHRQAIRCTIGRSLLRDWQAMATLLLVEHWSLLQIPPESMIISAEGLNIAGDMAHCLACDMVVELARRPQRWRFAAGQDADAIHFAAIQAFERRRGALRHLVAAIHARFHRWLLELESWR